MIALCTGDPTAKVEGEQIVMSFPSGADEVQIALTLHQATYMWNSAKRTVLAALDGDGFAAPKSAEIVQFPKKRRAKR